MIIWKVEFEYQLDGEDEWHPDGALHLGDFNGGAAVNFVRDNMLGTEVTITIGMNAGPWAVGPANTQSIVKKIVDWRMVGLTRIGKLNFVDTNTLIAAGIIEAVVAEDLVPTEVGVATQSICSSRLGNDGENRCGNCLGHCPQHDGEEHAVGEGIPAVVGTSGGNGEAT